MNFYTILEIAPDANADEIKKAFRRLAKKYHPDVSQEPDAESRFKLVYMAYEILGDASKRQLYDELQLLRAEAEKQRSEARMRRWQENAQRQAQGYANMNYKKFEESMRSRINFHASQGVAFLFSFSLLCLGFICVMLGTVFIFHTPIPGWARAGFLLWPIGAAFIWTGGKAVLGVFNAWTN